MNLLARSFAASVLSLLAVGAACAQQSEPGTGSTQLAPASAVPQTTTQPNLRVDSTPHTNLSSSTDSAPLPETLGMDATPLMDMGLDWSLPQDTTLASTTRRIVTNKKGQTSVVEVASAPAVPRPVTNPPEPGSRQILDIPQPPIVYKPTPPDPLTGIPQ